MKRPRLEDIDLRRFLFTATGEHTDPGDTFDNLMAELDKLEAVIELLEVANVDEMDSSVVPHVGLLLKDIWRRMEAIVRLGLDPSPRSSA